MTIETTEFANVSISVSPTGVSSGDFGILGFLTEDGDAAVVGREIDHTTRSRLYGDLASVGADWQTSSEVYKAATAFYGQTPTPKDFVAMVNYRTAQFSKLVGGGSLSPAELVAATWNGTGVLTLTIDGVTTAITDLDVSSASPVTYDAIAILIEDALQLEVGLAAATCIHNGYQFVIGGIVAGAAGAITFASDTSAAQDLGLTQATARISGGLDAETAVAAIDAVENQGTDYVALVTHKMFRDSAFADDSGDSAIDIAKALEAHKKIFCNTTNDLTHLATGNTNIGSKLKALTLRYSLSSFARDVNAYPSCSVFGRAASVNFGGINTVITLNLKQMPGIAAEDLTPGEFAALRSYYVSAVVSIGGAANGYTDSRMASGSWLDTTHGLMWLENRCEVDLFNLLYQTNTSIPFTQDGINISAATLTNSLRFARRNGLCAPGYLPDGEYLVEGYKVYSVPLAEVPTSDKGDRIYAGLSFKMVGSGALHGLIVNGEFAE